MGEVARIVRTQLGLVGRQRAGDRLYFPERHQAVGAHQLVDPARQRERPAAVENLPRDRELECECRALILGRSTAVEDALREADLDRETMVHVASMTPLVNEGTPAAMLGGITGQFYRQFALTIAAAMIISAVNAMTMTPSRAVMIFKDYKHGAHGHEDTREALPWWGYAALLGWLGATLLEKHVVPLVGLAPLRRYSPRVGRSRQPRRERSVDFPDPEGPMIATASPSATDRLTSSSAATSRTPRT